MSENEGFRPRRSFAPVKVGDELDVKIEAVGEKGDGIAKKDGFVLFVPGVSEGDEVKIRVTKVLRKVGFAEVAGAGSKKEKAEEPEASEDEPAEEASKSEESAEEETDEETEEDADDDTEDSEDFGDEEDK